MLVCFPNEPGLISAEGTGRILNVLEESQGVGTDCNPMTRKMEAGESDLHSHAWLHSEFEASLGYADLVTNSNRSVLERK